MKTPAYTLTKSFASITFIEEGKNVIVKSFDKNYDRVVDLIKTENWKVLRNLLLPQFAVKIMSQGKIDIIDGGILYNGKHVHHDVASKIIEAVEEKLPVKNLMAFLENILDCDKQGSVLDELFLFLESNESMPIMEDGSFLAYRVVDHEYMSKHPNPDGSRNRNKIGDVVEYDKDKVDPVRSHTCSRGLHFCSLSYVPFYGYSNRDRVMIVKIFPQHVVSIPNDYNNSKGRCYQYEVIGEVADYGSEDFIDRAPVELENTAYASVEKVSSIRDMVPSEHEMNVKYSNMFDVFKKVESIINSQSDAYKTATARSVSKSTRNPYVPVADVIAIADSLGYSIDFHADSLSNVEIC